MEAFSCRSSCPSSARSNAPSVPAPGDAGADPYLVQRAVTEFLLRLSRLRPLLLVSDDLHWADGGTLQLARSSGADGSGGADGRRWLRSVTAARRSSPSSPRPSPISHALEGVTRLGLDDLSIQEVSAFIRASTAADASGELVVDAR